MDGSARCTPVFGRLHRLVELELMVTSGLRTPGPSMTKGPQGALGHGYGAPGEIRTPDRLVRSQVLYPAELRARISDSRGLYSTGKQQKKHQNDIICQPTRGPERGIQPKLGNDREQLFGLAALAPFGAAACRRRSIALGAVVEPDR